MYYGDGIKIKWQNENLDILCRGYFYIRVSNNTVKKNYIWSWIPGKYNYEFHWKSLKINGLSDFFVDFNLVIYYNI